MYPSIHSSDDASCSDGTLPSGACVRYGCLDSRALNYDSRANRASTSSRFACVMPARPAKETLSRRTLCQLPPLNAAGENLITLHAIAAVRALKSSLSATAGGKAA